MPIHQIILFIVFLPVLGMSLKLVEQGHRRAAALMLGVFFGIVISMT